MLIRHKLLLLFLGLSTVPMVAISVFAFKRSVEAVERMLTEQTQVIVADMLERAGESLEKPVRGLRGLTQVEALIDTLSEPRCWQQSDESIAIELKARCRRGEMALADFFLGYRSNYARLYAVSFVGLDPTAIPPVAFRVQEVVNEGGALRAYVEPTPRMTVPPELVEDLRRRDQAAPVRSDLRVDKIGYVQTVGIPVHRLDEGRRVLIGAIFGDLQVSRLLADVGKAQKLGRSGESLVVSAEGIVLHHPQPSYVNQRIERVLPDLEPLLDELSAPQPTTKVFTRPDHTTWLMTAARDQTFGWSVGFATPLSIFIRLPERAARINLVIALLSALAGLIGLVSIGAVISRNVRSLTVAARRIATGELSTRIHVQSRDEVGQLAEIFNEMAEELSELVDQRIKDERIREELRIGSQIQQRVLPDTFPQPAAAEVWGLMSPATEIGGDYFDVLPLSETSFLVAIGDVSGKGVPAGLVMVQASTVVRSMALVDEPLETIMMGVHRLLLPRMAAHNFMSLLLMRYDTTSRQLSFCGAGHEHLLIYRADRGLVEARRGGGTAVGIVEIDAVRVHTTTTELRPGDVVLVYTDGVTEARDERGEFFGLERLKDLFRDHAGEAARDAVNHIVDHVKAFQHGSEQLDDMTLVMIRVLEGDES